MTTVAILPISDPNGERIYRAVAGDKQSIGKTAGQALDALTTQLETEETSTMLIIQSFQPDSLFSAEQQQRLTELMNLRRTAQNQGQEISPDHQAELDTLVEAELKAAIARSAALDQSLNETRSLKLIQTEDS
jgi:hypothetical protein